MGKVNPLGVGKKAAGLAVGAIVVIVAGYFLIRSVVSFQQGYKWAEMDWNQDGHTSISEFIASTDIGTRTVQRNGQDCTEYFAYKDGLPVKVVCPEEKAE